MPEYPPIQVVDKDDKPLRGAGLQEIHQQGLIHRIVYILVEDKSGKILLQRRGANVATYPNHWDVAAAGHVDEGENYETAAARELAEELGLSGHKLKEVDRFYSETKHDGLIRNRFCRVYRVVIPENTELKVEPEEISEVRWFTRRELKTFLEKHTDQLALGLQQTIERHYDIWKSLA